MDLTLRQKQTLLNTVNNRLFVLEHDLRDIEKSESFPYKDIAVRNYRLDIDDLRCVKKSLEIDVY